MRGIFITGTDTGVGKTIVASGLALALRRAGRHVVAVKPYATGVVRRKGEWISRDGELLAAASGSGLSARETTPCLLRAALSPAAAAREKNPGEILKFGEVVRRTKKLIAGSDVAIIEGIGGLLVPLDEKRTVADLAKALGFPLLIIARAGLGTLNHTLLTLEAAQNRKLKVAAVVLCETKRVRGDVSAKSNRKILEERAGIAIFGPVRFRNELTGRDLGAKDVGNLPDLSNLMSRLALQ
ncbi:MAG: dethiobiotin synthase [bacterium]